MCQGQNRSSSWVVPERSTVTAAPLDVAGGERIARARLCGLESGGQPALALLGGAVSPHGAVNHPAGRVLLKVVADQRCGSERVV